MRVCGSFPRFVVLVLLGLAVHLQAAIPQARAQSTSTTESPQVVSQVLTSDYLLRPGKELGVGLLFSQPLDVSATPDVSLRLSGVSRPIPLEGRWEQDGRGWRATVQLPQLEKAEEAVLVVQGLRTLDGGAVAKTYEETLLVGRERLVACLRDLCDWMMAHTGTAIFVEGYNERTILGAYEILGEERYLAHARRWSQHLLATQKPEGHWATGYGDVYLADTASALGLLLNICRYVPPEEQRQIQAALQRYSQLVFVKGDSKGRSFVHDDGSLGVGFATDIEGNIQGDLPESYTISTALTGAGIASVMYQQTGEGKYQQFALGSLRWIFGTMLENGELPYIRGDDVTYLKLFPYDTSTYVGEGLITAWTNLDDPAVRAEIEKMVKPHIEWVLRTQNADGGWGKPSSKDQMRSHGVVNLLLWYYYKVTPDERVTTALRRYTACLLSPAGTQQFGVKGSMGKNNHGNIATSLVGRAVVDLIQPGIDCRPWKAVESKPVGGDQQ